VKYHNGEKQVNLGRPVMQVWLILGVREKGIGKDFFHSYQEPSLVPHAEKAKVVRRN